MAISIPTVVRSFHGAYASWVIMQVGYKSQCINVDLDVRKTDIHVFQTSEFNN